MVANRDINKHSIFREHKIKMKCQWLYELPLAQASGEKDNYRSALATLM